MSSLASASNALSVPGALISETPTGAGDEFATSSPIRKSAAAGIVTCGAPAKPGGDERGDHLFVIGKIVVEEPRGGDEEDASEE